MNIDITLHFFIDVSDGWFWFVNFTFNWIRWFQVSIFVNFTYWVVTFWYNLIGLTIWCLDSIRFFTFLSGVIWCVIWWVWCILTRFLNFFTFFVYVSDDNFTLFRFCWIFFQFVDVSDILITFDHFTSCSVITCPMTLFVNLTYFVVTCWYQFVCLTLEFDFLWTVVNHCIVIFINWLIFFICYFRFDYITFCIYIVNIDITLHFFIDVSDGWFWFSNLACNWVRWFKVTIFINLTYRIVTFWYDLICLTVFCLDNIRLFTFFSSVIWCIIWWVWCVLTWFLKFLTLFIHISDNNFTFWFFFQLVDVGDILIFLSNFSSCRIWRLQVSLVIYLTNCVVTSRGQLVSLTFELNLIRTIIYNCIVGLINWLIFFISYIWLNSLAFCILIMHVNISFNIRLNKVVVYISWRFNRCWNWVVIREWWVTLQIRVYFTICWCCRIIRYRSFCLNHWNFTSNDVVTVITSSGRCQWRIWGTFEWTWISV